MEHVERKTTRALMGMFALLAVASLALVAAIPADAETTEIDVTYHAQDPEAGEPSVEFPVAGLSGVYYASLISVSEEGSTQNYIQATTTTSIDDAAGYATAVLLLTPVRPGSLPERRAHNNRGGKLIARGRGPH